MRRRFYSVLLVVAESLAFGVIPTEAQTLGAGGDLAGTLPNVSVSHVGGSLRIGDNLPSFVKIFGSDSTANIGRVGYVGMVAMGADTSINIAIVPKNGCIIARIPDGSSTGGQACGIGSVDLQVAGTANGNGILAQSAFSFGLGNYASNASNYSFLGGYSNQMSGSSPGYFAYGYLNSITGQYGVLFGRDGNDHQRFNLFQWSPKSWNDTLEGKSQLAWGLFGFAYSDTTSHILTSDRGSYNVAALNAYKVSVGYAYTISCTALSVVSGVATGAAEMSTLAPVLIDVPAAGTINMSTAAGAQASIPFTAVSPSTGAAVSVTLTKDTSLMAITITAQASAAAARRTQARCDLQENGKL